MRRYFVSTLTLYPLPRVVIHGLLVSPDKKEAEDKKLILPGVCTWKNFVLFCFLLSLSVGRRINEAMD